MKTKYGSVLNFITKSLEIGYDDYIASGLRKTIYKWTPLQLFICAGGLIGGFIIGSLFTIFWIIVLSSRI